MSQSIDRFLQAKPFAVNRIKKDTRLARQFLERVAFEASARSVKEQVALLLALPDEAMRMHAADVMREIIDGEIEARELRGV